MQAVGRIGSYISKSVYSVSGPFHPFGGAVDIIVVEQPDGSYKSSPWYVRFGKFQGVLKTREKLVDISVNGVEADFHMHLDHKGEAYFMTEVDLEEVECSTSPPSSSGEDMDRQSDIRWPMESKGGIDNANWSDSIFNERDANDLGRTKSRRSQILGLVFGRRSKKENIIDEEGDASDAIRTDSLERAEMAADLLELKWSTNLGSFRNMKNNSSLFSVSPKEDDNEESEVDDCTGHESVLLTRSRYQEMESTVEENGTKMKCLNSEYVAETATSINSVKENAYLIDELGLAKADRVEFSDVSSEIVKTDSQTQDSNEKLNTWSDTNFSKEENMEIQAVYDSETSGTTKVELEKSIEQTSVASCHDNHGEVSIHSVIQSISEVKSELEGDVLHGQETLKIQECFRKGDQITIVHEERIAVSGSRLYTTSESIETDSHPQMSSCDCVGSCNQSSRNSVKEQLLFGELDDFASNENESIRIIHADNEEKDTNSSFLIRVSDGVNGSYHEKCCSSFSLDQSVINDYINDANIREKRLRTIRSDACISTTGNAPSKGLTRTVRSSPKMWPLQDSLEAHDLRHSSHPSLDSCVKSHINNSHHPLGARSLDEDVKILKECGGLAKSFIVNPPRSIDSLRGSRRSLPFSSKRSRSIQVSHPCFDANQSFDATIIVKNTCDLDSVSDATKVRVNKKKVRTLTPTSEQLKSLNLKEGRNVVIFAFSTAMLGRQQVDARIFLWRWDTQIVISDVDGTITRSDLLGQVMPLVGMDWSQTGVAHLFSSIKENGYQLLFLSARSISQAFLTRQFLFNINQDGKALPDGPVVISPDGLFPSLFREVVRRAPHEFKIACLEDIKALFPADKNPFYAGFGNRDTDEFSYLKVGIPRGKIFIINPKGEIVVNRRVDTKSYVSLHALVHGMFPSMSSCEQEDFNSWNFWKLPPPTVDF